MNGILFKPEMIKAIAERRKTQTRRVIKPQPDNDLISPEVFNEPRYQVGETVYIKEALGRKPLEDFLTGELMVNHEHAYYLLDNAPVVEEGGFDLVPWWKGKTLSPMFLPKEFARYFITITDVRAERLQEITEEDGKAEGIQTLYKTAPHTFGAGYIWTPHGYMDGFIKVWNSINKDYPLESNPFIFRYEFEYKEG